MVSEVLHCSVENLIYLENFNPCQSFMHVDDHVEQRLDIAGLNDTLCFEHFDHQLVGLISSLSAFILRFRTPTIPAGADPVFLAYPLTVFHPVTLSILSNKPKSPPSRYYEPSPSPQYQEHASHA